MSTYFASHRANRSNHTLNERLRGYCWGLGPRVPRDTSYGHPRNPARDTPELSTAVPGGFQYHVGTIGAGSSGSDDIESLEPGQPLIGLPPYLQNQ
jgi:hypothetical protein